MTQEETDSWDNVYLRWQFHHAVVFGWVTSKSGKTAVADSAAALFVTWEPWFAKLEPSERELMDATEFVAMDTASHDCKWERHYPMLRTQIVRDREIKRWRARQQRPEITLEDVPHMSANATSFVEGFKIGKLPEAE